ncbi:LysR family transcriptional regulator [Cryobacterium melibiosiphilum]|uniref:LysR family transcriptional regulator n=1 Tax=Cryobacterium melibiosiphilum TaxID=995039 RepID=A0A3A5MHI1_9MICO|nr:LysR family transcriptional regulator [Cryobacterium melibiosiphilum]RJT85291.1 LysR family transcriptional regulator [Cryobacterium melibiosiphilum]
MDLNLLRTFLSVYETGSLTRSARDLYVTQPSVSHSLAHLRREFSDELFVRRGRGMVPTLLADELYPVVKDSVGSIDNVVLGMKSFDPASSTHRFRLCLSDLGELAFLPQILKTISRDAPEVEIEVVPMDIRLLPDWLTRGSVDAAIASWPLAGEYGGTLLKTEEYVCVLRADYPMAGPELTLDEFLRARHVIVDPVTGHQLAEQAMQALGIVRRSTVVVQHFAVIPELISECNLFAIAPESMARRWLDKWPVRLAALPFDVGAVEVKLYLRANGRESSALAWFRTAVSEALKY